MEVANFDVEPFSRGLGKNARLLKFLGIEVDVRVKIRDLHHFPDMGSAIEGHKQQDEPSGA